MKAILWASLGLALAALPAAAREPMIHKPVARLQGLDKITARISNFTAPVGKPVRFGRLVVVVRDCEKNPPIYRPDSAAFLQISEERRGGGEKQLFSGWMFSASPALSALENPIYDIELLGCESARASSGDKGSTGKAAAPASASASSLR